MKKAIISDLDGTLALLGGRNPYTPKTILKDKINKAPAEILRVFYEYKKVTPIIVSGRFENYRLDTVKWLKQNGLDFAELYLRPDDDFRKDYAFKREVYDTHIKPNYEVIFCLDDRNQSVDFWRSLGLTCLQVAPGDF